MYNINIILRCIKSYSRAHFVLYASYIQATIYTLYILQSGHTQFGAGLCCSCLISLITQMSRRELHVISILSGVPVNANIPYLTYPHPCIQLFLNLTRSKCTYDIIQSANRVRGDLTQPLYYFNFEGDTHFTR